MSMVLGVIGGSGLYAVDGLTAVETLTVTTPYGEPSAPLTRGLLDKTTLLFLPRHGVGHRISPTEINFRANICALKLLGATHVISISAVGSLREDMAPGEVVVIDQYLDRTYRRQATFFEKGIVAHVSLADPVCPMLSAAAAAAARRAGAVVHENGTYICIEGPQFSTRAESQHYRSLRADVIGMTAMPEARLAREAQLPYSTVAMVTDYDCWHRSEEAVTVEQVVAVMNRNSALARRTIAELVPTLPDPTLSPAYDALSNAIITNPDVIDSECRQRLSWLLDSKQ